MTRLLQCLKTNKISGFLSGRGNTSPLPWLGRPQARPIHNRAKQSGWSSIRKHGDEGFDDILKRLALRESSGNERRQGPQRLCLGVTTPTSCRTIQRGLDMALQLVKQELIVLGGTQ